MSRSMYIAASFCVVGLLFSSFVAAQSVDPAFLKARDARGAAAAAGNDEEYGRYTTNAYVFTDPNGVVKTKTQRMAEVKAARPATPPATAGQPAPPKDEEFHAYGNATIVRTWEANFQNQPTRFTETWVKEDGLWKVASGHLSFIKKT